MALNPRQFGQQELPGVERGTRANPSMAHPLAHVGGGLLRLNAQWTKRNPNTAETRDKFVRDANEGQLSVRFDSDNYRGILGEGEFRNQHHTGTSNGSYDPDERADYERNAWGYDTGDPARNNPIYGYMHHPTGDHALNYGDLRAVLKPQVRERTTVTAGDSLGAGLPLPVNEVAKGKVPKTALGFYHERDYTEAQIHGPVRVGRGGDVDHVEIPDPNEYTHKLTDTLTDHGVPWRTMRTERYEQRPLPLADGQWGRKASGPEWSRDVHAHSSISHQQFEIERSPGFTSHYMERNPKKEQPYPEYDD